MSRFLHLVVVEGCPDRPYLGASARSTMTGYDSLTFTRQTAEQIAADLNKDACGLTASWDGDSLIFNATAEYNGDAFSETVVPDAHGHYEIGGLWPWGLASKDVAPDEHEAEQLLGTGLRGQGRPHRHLVTRETKPLEVPSTNTRLGPARRQR
ncbi:hypothetical protein ACGFYT_27535 [Streptomyces sp. NPDC048208]|uniref:hypothetical protein n=1 Tax=Streptomyces sp. NPDC048208 TaxID=3365515 RepID=UPI00371340F1